MSINSVANSAAVDLASAQKQIQQMAREQTAALSVTQITHLKNLLRQSELLDSERLDAETINALGKLLFLASADREFQSRATQGNVLERLNQRIGIDVDARGFVNLADRINVSHGEDPVYGSTRRNSGSPLTAEQVRNINLARRYQGLTKVEGDKSNAAPFPDEPLPLAMRHPAYPNLPDVRAELFKLMALDQEARQAPIRGASEAEKQAAYQHMGEIDAQVQARFFPIFKKYGFPTNSMVGHSGTLAAWVLIQHAIVEPELMNDAAKQATALHERGELPDGPYALLVDRVACLIEHKPQTYGSFGDRTVQSDPNNPHYCPIEQPVADVNKRRAAIFMAPIDMDSNRK